MICHPSSPSHTCSAQVALKCSYFVLLDRASSQLNLGTLLHLCLLNKLILNVYDVTFDGKLCFNSHFASIVNYCTRICNFILRSSIKPSQATFSSLVSNILEYYFLIWSLIRNYDCHLPEVVHRKLTRFLLFKMLSREGLVSLRFRSAVRRRFDSFLFFKILQMSFFACWSFQARGSDQKCKMDMD